VGDGEVRTLSDEVIKHYGHTDMRVDLHPNQVQPEHIVITSPYFRVDERDFGMAGGCGCRATESIRGHVVMLREGGLTFSAIADTMGISKSQAFKYCKGMRR